MYLTVYNKVKSSWLSVGDFKYDKTTLTLDSYDDYMPSEKQSEEEDKACDISYWSNDLIIETDVASRYHTFQVPKRSGGMREIKEPLGNCKLIQKNICYKMKSNLRILPHDCCHGFVKGRRCLSAMQKHQKNQSNWFLKLDIHNFFPSVSKEHISHLFEIIPQLCGIPQETEDYILDVLVDETGHLTQGCVSSPYIANLVLLEFDVAFSKWCRDNNLIYTRYADDMCISSRVKFNVRDVVAAASSMLPDGITLNNEKTKMTSIAGENVFLGLHYNQNKDITVGHETKHLMKVIAHKIELGQIPQEELKTWKGRYVYYKSIEPAYFSHKRFDIFGGI